MLNDFFWNTRKFISWWEYVKIDTKVMQKQSNRLLLLILYIWHRYKTWVSIVTNSETIIEGLEIKFRYCSLLGAPAPRTCPYISMLIFFLFSRLFFYTSFFTSDRTKKEISIFFHFFLFFLDIVKNKNKIICSSFLTQKCVCKI